MLLHNLPRPRQPDASAGDPSGHVPAPMEPVEDVRQVGRRDAEAVILNLEDRPQAGGVCRTVILGPIECIRPQHAAADGAGRERGGDAVPARRGNAVAWNQRFGKIMSQDLSTSSNRDQSLSVRKRWSAAASAPAGHIEMGALAAAVGAPTAIVANGILVVVGALVLVARAPAFRWQQARVDLGV